MKFMFLFLLLTISVENSDAGSEYRCEVTCEASWNYWTWESVKHKDPAVAKAEVIKLCSEGGGRVDQISCGYVVNDTECGVYCRRKERHTYKSIQYGREEDEAECKGLNECRDDIFSQDSNKPGFRIETYRDNCYLRYYQD